MLFKIIVKDVHEIFGLYLSPRPFKNSQSDHTAPSSISLVKSASDHWDMKLFETVSRLFIHEAQTFIYFLPDEPTQVKFL